MTKIYYFLGHEQFQPEIVVDHAVRAEQAGFDGVFVSEHFNPWVADSGAAGFALSTLGAIAAKTTQLELMTGVITPLFRYHPAVVAQAAATLDRLSDGRFALGVGTGEPLNEVPLGYSYPSYVERAERMTEALQIMKQLLSGEKLTFHGVYYQTNNAKLYSPPLHPLSIFLAAGGPKSACLAADQADGVIVSVKKIEDAQEKVIEPFREERKNHPGKIIATHWSIFAHSQEEAGQALKSWRGLRAPHRDSLSDPEQLQHEADALSLTDVLRRYTIVSSAEEYLAAYKPLITELNADYIVIQTTSVDQLAVIKFLGENVLPELRKIK